MSLHFSGIIKGLILSLAVTLLSMVLIASISYFTEVSQKAVDIFIFIGLGIGVFSGAYAVARGVQEKCAVYGIIIGIFSIILFLICSFLVNGAILFNSHSLSILCVCLLSGFFGGILGR